MSHYDGPAFYRKFMREGAINKARKTEFLNRKKRQNHDHQLEFANDTQDTQSVTQKMDFGKFRPSHRSYHVDLQNNPVARITAAFHPKRHYSTHRLSPDLHIDNQQGFQPTSDQQPNPFSSQTLNHSSESDEGPASSDEAPQETQMQDDDFDPNWTGTGAFQPLFQSFGPEPSSSSSSSSRETQTGFDFQEESEFQESSSIQSSSSESLHQSFASESSESTQQESSVNRVSVSGRDQGYQKAYSDNPTPLGHDFNAIMHAEEENIGSNLALFDDSSNDDSSSSSSTSREEAGDSDSSSADPVDKTGLSRRSQGPSQNPDDVIPPFIKSEKINRLTQPNTNLQNNPSAPDEDSDQPHHEINHRVVSDYDFPGSDLLTAPQRQDDQDLDDWILRKAEVLNKTLKAFKVNAQVVDWTNGPTVTQFQIRLHLGVKVSKIRHLADDLKMALAAKDIRIEAPIPGKTTCGIEIPNPKPRPVMLSEVVDSPAFKNSKSTLTVALGVDLSGHPRVTDLRKMPHGLIAGATGSGKSVFINSLLLSLLYKATPEQLRMILIDPKAVELAPYNKIPHLLSPVISEPKQAAAALKWTVKEMDQRYDKLAAAGVRNIEQFNQTAEENGEPDKKMPYILIVIDELADLMMVASDEVEAYIVRITQKARAAGIHLIVATQRPSVDIVTGTIKNNIPTRVAFMVSSQVDSRTIIDTSGAERLLGKGDMLYLGSGNSHPIRLQGCFVSGKEVDRVTNFVRQQEPAQYAFQPGSLLKKVNHLKNQDALMPRVLAYIAREKTISTSKLQRIFSIGYNRAAKLIDDLEQHNYISGPQGSKPRDIYLTEDDYKKLNL